MLRFARECLTMRLRGVMMTLTLGSFDADRYMKRVASMKESKH